MILFATPVYLLFAEGDIPVNEALRFFITEEEFAISIFWQFILLELAVDGLKLASLNTPDSLGMSLSVIGALILGEFSVSSGWFVPADHPVYGCSRSGKLHAAQHRVGIRDQIRTCAHVDRCSFAGLGGRCHRIFDFSGGDGLYQNDRWNILLISTCSMGLV